MKPNLSKLQAKVDAFNAQHPVGSMVYVTTDDGKIRYDETTAKAEVLSGYTPVVWLKNTRGCYDLDRIRPAGVTTNRFINELQLFHDYISIYGDNPGPDVIRLIDYIKMRVKTHLSALDDGWVCVDDAHPEEHTSLTGVRYSKVVEVLSKGNVKETQTTCGQFPDGMIVSHWRPMKPGNANQPPVP